MMKLKYATVIFFLNWAGIFLTFSQDRGVFTDERDGRRYQTVQIGDQIWMAENLAFLPRVDQVKSGVFEEECFWVYGYFGRDPEEAIQTFNFKTYGVLYNWLAATNSCPEGWHLPGEPEWQELELSLGMSREELSSRSWRQSGSPGKKLKKETGWFENTGTNESGFGALPGGCMGYGGFESMGFGGFFWTGTKISTENAFRRTLLYEDDGIERTEDRMYFGCSVRCVKDR